MSDARLARGSILLLGLTVTLALGVPIALSLVGPLEQAVGESGTSAIVASVVLSVAAVAGFVYVRERASTDLDPASRDRRLFRAAGISTIIVLVLFPVQMSVFALAWPPPETAVAYFDLLATNKLVGLMSLDLLLMVDWIVLLVAWAGLYVALRPTAPRTMLVTIGLVLLATLAYFLSNTAFDMLALSQQHASAATATERATALAAGERALATFEGPWFTASYLLSGLATLLGSVVMWRAPAFGKLVGGIGIAYALMQAVPPNFGTFGMIVSVLSLLPMLAWLALTTRALLRMGRAPHEAEGNVRPPH